MGFQSILTPRAFDPAMNAAAAARVHCATERVHACSCGGLFVQCIPPPSCRRRRRRFFDALFFFLSRLLSATVTARKAIIIFFGHERLPVCCLLGTISPCVYASSAAFLLLRYTFMRFHLPAWWKVAFKSALLDQPNIMASSLLCQIITNWHIRRNQKHWACTREGRMMLVLLGSSPNFFEGNCFYNKREDIFTLRSQHSSISKFLK